MRCTTVDLVDAVDAEGHLNALSGIFALASLGSIFFFFFRRAKTVSLGLLGWWICFVLAFFVVAPGTISGSEDVAGWATEAACAGLVGLVAGGWLGSMIGEPRVVATVPRGLRDPRRDRRGGPDHDVLLSNASCGGWLSAEHVREGYELDTTFCAANDVLGRWAVVDVVCVVSLFLLAAHSARRNASVRGEERIAGS
jgi:hypothetical protein